MLIEFGKTDAKAILDSSEIIGVVRINDFTRILLRGGAEAAVNETFETARSKWKESKANGHADD